MLVVDMFPCFDHTIKHILTIVALEYFLSNSVFVSLDACSVVKDQVVVLLGFEVSPHDRPVPLSVGVDVHPT